MRSMIIYLLLSVVVALCGALAIVATGEDHPIGLAVATGILSAGLASTAFSVITFLQAKDEEGTVGRLDALASQLQQGLSSLRQAQVLADVSNARRIFDRHPDEEVRETIDRTAGQLRVDVMGLTLKPFCSQQVPLLKQRGNAHLRVLIQDPTNEIFHRICRQESRDVLSSLEDAVSHGLHAGVSRSGANRPEVGDSLVRPLPIADYDPRQRALVRAGTLPPRGRQAAHLFRVLHR